MQERLEQFISLVDIIKLLYRKILLILSITIIGLLAGLLYGNYIIEPQYSATSTIVVNKDVPINESIQTAAVELVKSSDVLVLATATLENQNITMISGRKITPSLLKDNIFVLMKSNSQTVIVTFTSHTQNDIELIVNAITSSAVAYGNENYPIFTSDLITGELAQTSTYSGISKLVIYLVGTLLGFLVSVSGLVCYAFFGGKVFFVTNFSSPRIPVNLMCLNQKKDSDDSISSKILKLQNAIEAHSSVPKNTVIGFISPQNDDSLDLIMNTFARNYANENLTVLIINLDLLNSTYHHRDSTEIEENSIVQYVLNDKNPRIYKLNHNIDYYEGGYTKFSSRVLKDTKVKSLIESSQKKYDFVLIKLTPNSKDDSFLPMINYLDTLLINVTLESTTEKQLKSLLHSCLLSDFDSLFLNFVRKKTRS